MQATSTKLTGQEAHNHWECDDHKDNEDGQSPSEAFCEHKGEEVSTIMTGDCRQAVANPFLAIKDESKAILIRKSKG